MMYRLISNNHCECLWYLVWAYWFSLHYVLNQSNCIAQLWHTHFQTSVNSLPLRSVLEIPYQTTNSDSQLNSVYQNICKCRQKDGRISQLSGFRMRPGQSNSQFYSRLYIWKVGCKHNSNVILFGIFITSITPKFYKQHNVRMLDNVGVGFD